MHIELDDLSILIRSAEPDDDRFISGMVDRLIDFDLPKWRPRVQVKKGIRNDLLGSLDNPPPGFFLFIAEQESTGEPVALLHLQLVTDFFTGHQNCHVSDLGVVDDLEGEGIRRALLNYAEEFARDHRCERLTLATFPGNEAGKTLYEEFGYGVELLRMTRPL